MDETTINKKEFTRTESFLLGSAVVTSIIGIITLGIYIYIFCKGEGFHAENKLNDSKFGNFGSLVGGSVGALWSLVGVILFYVTLRLQRNELVLQREELKLTRDELKGQKEQMEKQNLTLIRQQFENTFFQLLSLHHQIVNAMDIRNTTNGNIIQQGRDVFKSRYSILRRRRENDDLENVLKHYIEIYKENQTDFGHYFRNLYHIFKFVDISELSNEEKYKYVTFVRAQLSSPELALLFYNALTENGIEKFKPLIEKYHLFKNLDLEYLIDTSHKNSYSNSAFS